METSWEVESRRGMKGIMGKKERERKMFLWEMTHPILESSSSDLPHTHTHTNSHQPPVPLH